MSLPFFDYQLVILQVSLPFSLVYLLLVPSSSVPVLIPLARLADLDLRNFYQS